jgi:hypothetical protein
MDMLTGVALAAAPCRSDRGRLCHVAREKIRRGLLPLFGWEARDREKAA